MTLAKKYLNPGLSVKKLACVRTYLRSSNSQSLGQDWGHQTWFYLLFYLDDSVVSNSFDDVESIVATRGDTTKHVTYFQSRTGRFIQIDSSNSAHITISGHNTGHRDGAGPMIDRLAELLRLEPVPVDPVTVEEASEAGNDFRFALEAFVHGKFERAKLIGLAKVVPVYAESLLRRSMPFASLVPDAVLSMLDVIWHINVPADFIQRYLTHIPSVDDGAVQDLLIEKIKEEPGRFTKCDLKQILTLRRNTPLGNAATELLAHHLESIADSLLGVHLGLSEDLQALKQSVHDYGFDPALNDAIQKIDAELARPGDSFDQAATIKHLRTFYEKLHQQVGEELRRRIPGTVDRTDLASCGQALEFLKRKEVLTEKMFRFGKALYGVLSDEGVHALTAKQEYVRLCRNMVAEYGTVMFFELENRLTSSAATEQP